MIPPALKIHPTVLDLLERDHSVRSDTEDELFSFDKPPEVDMLVVKFVKAFDSQEHMEEEYHKVERYWSVGAGAGADADTDSIHQVRSEVALKSLGTGRWRKVLSMSSMGTDESDSSAGSAAPCTFAEMASDIVFYRDFIEFRHVDSYLRSGGVRAKHCVAQLVHRISSDKRVLSVSGQSIPRLLNYLAKGVCQSGDASSKPLTDSGLTGDGEIVGVADSGLNDASCFFWDNSGAYDTKRIGRRSIGSSYVEMNRRKVIQYISHADGQDEIGGHGTHVVGTIAGNSLNSDYAMGNGVAPGAKVAFVDVQNSDSPYLSIPDLSNKLLTTLYGAGARVFSNSWGGNADGLSLLYVPLIDLNYLFV